MPASPFTIALAPLPEPAARILPPLLQSFQQELDRLAPPSSPPFEIAALDGPLPDSSPSFELASLYLAELQASVLVWPQLSTNDNIPLLVLVTGSLEHPTPPRFPLQLRLPLPSHPSHGFCSLIAIAAVFHAIAFYPPWTPILASSFLPLLEKSDAFLRSSQAQQAFFFLEDRGHAHLLLAHAQSFWGLSLEDMSLLEAAVRQFKKAEEDLPRQEIPQSWARARVGRAEALSRLSRHDPDASKLWTARALLMDALEEIRPEELPFEWAGAQRDLGVALTRLGDRLMEASHFEEAVRAFRQTLLEWTREQEPLLWAMTLSELGYALMRLGELEGNSTYLHEAVKAFQFSLMELAKGQEPESAWLSRDYLQRALSAVEELRTNADAEEPEES